MDSAKFAGRVVLIAIVVLVTFLVWAMRPANECYNAGYARDWATYRGKLYCSACCDDGLMRYVSLEDVRAGKVPEWMGE